MNFLATVKMSYMMPHAQTKPTTTCDDLRASSWPTSP